MDETRLHDTQHDPRLHERHAAHRDEKPRWPIFVGAFVFLGSLATVASAFWASWLK